MKASLKWISTFVLLACAWWFFAQKNSPDSPRLPLETPSPLKIPMSTKPSHIENSQKQKFSQVVKPDIEIKFDEETEKFISLIESGEVFNTPVSRSMAHYVDGNWITQGDILISPEELVPGLGNATAKIAKLKKARLWPHNEVPYVIDPSLDPHPIELAVAAINNLTNVKFVTRSGQEDFVYFKPTTKHCSSFVGRVGGKQAIYINEAICKSGQILHEIMHALGFVHEHSRADRDDFIEILWPAIPEGLLHQFQKMDNAVSIPAPTSFDFESVLLYGSVDPETEQVIMTKKDGSLFFANRRGLSHGDIEKINALYP